MPLIRNFDQLLIIKQLFQEANDLATRQDNFSLTKAIILFDLSIEITLKNIIIFLNPNYFNAQAYRKDLNFKDAWNIAEATLQKNLNVGLIEQTELFALHDSRNLTQHRGTIPSRQDILRFSTSVQNMLLDSFQKVFSFDFENLRSWDFIQNLALKEFLIESEEFLKTNNPIFSYYGCYFAKEFILNKLNEKGRKTFSWHTKIPEVKQNYQIPEWKNVVKLSESVVNMKKDLEEKLDTLDTELLLIGLGLPIVETRRFLNHQLPLLIGNFGKGKCSVAVVGKLETSEVVLISKFQLNYLYKLLRLLDEQNPNLLNSIEVSIPLNQYNIVQSKD